MSVGYDHIDVKELKKRNIRLGYTPDVLTDATADINLGLALMVTRNLYKGVKCVHEGGWGPWEPNFMVGTSISGKTIGIFGAGRIGQATARRFKGFNPSKIIYNSRSRKPEFEDEVGASFVSFDELVRTSDILSINCVFNEDTKHLFNADTFSKMKNSAILLNSSRGGVIKQDDLIQALKSGQLGGAGLDVTDPEPLPLDSELLKLENVVITPHVGSANIETREAMADLAIKNLIAGLNGEEMAAEVKL
jgi:glyoxylate/hydroxypyruvate reductase